MIVPLSLASLLIASAAAEPVVWTKMADPDPTFVAPKSTAKPKRSSAQASEPSDLNGAVANLMKVARDADEAIAIQRDYERQVRALEESIERTRRTVDDADALAESAPQR